METDERRNSMSARKVLPIKEKVIENSILSFLKRNNIYCWKNESVGIFDQKKGVYRRKNSIHRMNGVADILGILRGGKFLAIEVKSLRGRITEEQTAFLSSINAEGGIAFVARSIDEVAKQLGIDLR